jgi:hypothetical protein
MAHADDLARAFHRVQQGFLAAAAARFPRIPNLSDSGFVEVHLRELTGIVELPSLVVASLRGGQLVLVSQFFSQLPSDRLLLPNAIMSEPLHVLRDDVVGAADWVRARSPGVRRVAQYEWRDRPQNAMTLVLVGIRLGILEQQRDVQATSFAWAPLLHDVMSTLHGRDRRLAGHACRAWRRVACDAMLPVTDADVQAWVAPAITEMKHAYPKFLVNKHSVEVAWTLTSLWLQGCG